MAIKLNQISKLSHMKNKTPNNNKNGFIENISATDNVLISVYCYVVFKLLLNNVTKSY